MTENETLKLQARIDELEATREQLEDLLGDAENYLQHKPICARLLTKRDCDCGLVELMTRVHALEEEQDDDENGDDDEDEEDE